jgi:hypothetical protein
MGPELVSNMVHKPLAPKNFFASDSEKLPNINTKIAKVKIIASVAITSYRWPPLVIIFLTTAL